jgi:hypothetical protein
MRWLDIESGNTYEWTDDGWKFLDEAAKAALTSLANLETEVDNGEDDDGNGYNRSIPSDPDRPLSADDIEKLESAGKSDEDEEESKS